ncbi:MAG: chorismate-binding protein, partial [Patescibacteria group bacterium]|nr:chorismate-binding protein [Patescibacteria group bacterium]
MKLIHVSQKPTYIPSRDKEDIYRLFLLAEQEFSSCFFFESLGEQGMLSRYSILGFDPQHTVSAQEKQVRFDDKVYPMENPYTLLKKIMPQDRIARNYAGGLVGFLGYDAMNLFEQSLKVRSHPLFPRFLFDVYTDGVIYDKYTGELTYFYYDENRLATILRLLQQTLHRKHLVVSSLSQNTTKKEHASQVACVKEEISRGNTFQTVIGIQQEFSFSGDGIVLYDRLRKVNPSPFMYFFKSQGVTIIGASPELLFGMRDKQMQTFPLAGTIKRGKTPQEDMDFSYQLLTDPKERAEHSMLVDLHRNDMGKVARFGSVKV